MDVVRAPGGPDGDRPWAHVQSLGSLWAARMGTRREADVAATVASRGGRRRRPHPTMGGGGASLEHGATRPERGGAPK